MEPAMPPMDLTPEHIDAALDLLDSQHQPTTWEELQRSLLPVPDPDGFLPRSHTHATIPIPRDRRPSPADLRFIKACGERLRVRLAMAIDDHTPTP